jgi:hypothetical protein
MTNWTEPRYDLKSFFMSSYHLFKTLKEGWGEYLVGFPNLFRRDPANDFYKYRDPTDRTWSRRNALEWVSAFEIFGKIGYPYNESATQHFLKFSRLYLEKAKRDPNAEWMDFMLCSAVANLPNQYENLRDWLPSQIEQYLKSDKSPHQLMIYLKALKNCNCPENLKEQIIAKLLDWINNPRGTIDKQILIWSRLLTRMQWVPQLSHSEIKELISENFRRSFEIVYAVNESNWSNSPMILEAAYLVADDEKRKQIKQTLTNMLSPANFSGLKELFSFLSANEEALEYQEAVHQIKEKCKASVSLEECKCCIGEKKGDCWIRILSILTHTEPKLHSGYEVADKVIYSLQQGIYVVMKASEISKQTGEGDVLYRQCGSLFSIEHALVLYLNPFDTAPVVIEAIKKLAATSTANPRFEVINSNFIRQIYKKYLEMDKKR